MRFVLSLNFQEKKCVGSTIGGSKMPCTIVKDMMVKNMTVVKDRRVNDRRIKDRISNRKVKNKFSLRVSRIVPQVKGKSLTI